MTQTMVLVWLYSRGRCVKLMYEVRRFITQNPSVTNSNKSFHIGLRLQLRWTLRSGRVEPPPQLGLKGSKCKLESESTEITHHPRLLKNVVCPQTTREVKILVIPINLCFLYGPIFFVLSTIPQADRRPPDPPQIPLFQLLEPIRSGALETQACPDIAGGSL